MPELFFALPPSPTAPIAGHRAGPGVVYVEILVKPTFARCRAELHDVSADEVELLLDGPLDPGAVLFLRLPGLRSGDSVTQMGRVADAARVPDGRWLIDCRLAHRLSGAQLGQILGPGAG